MQLSQESSNEADMTSGLMKGAVLEVRGGEAVVSLNL